MAKRIYSLSGLTALALMIALIVSHPHINQSLFVGVVTLIYVVVTGSVHGLVAHSLTARQKRNQVVYPVAMGALYAVLAYAYMYLVLPQIVPGFF